MKKVFIGTISFVLVIIIITIISLVKEDNQLILVQNINIIEEEINLKYGNKIKINPVVTPTNATNKDLEWEIDETLLVIDKNGNITALKNENISTEVKVKTKDGNYVDVVKINIIKMESIINVTGLDITEKEITLSATETYKIKATVQPENATNTSIIWTSNSPNFIYVDTSGLIKVLENKSGSAIITAKTKDGGYTANIKVTVTSSNNVQVSDVTLNKESEIIYLNSNSKEIVLKAAITPTNATNKKITWASSDSSIASVDQNGKVKALKPGTADITVMTEDGNKKDIFKITVKQNIIIVIGASQVAKMEQHVDKYTKNNHNYLKNDQTLNYIYKSGSSFNYQVEEGFEEIKKIINNYSSSKKYVNIYLYFPVAGNGIKKYECSKITATNTNIKDSISLYNSAIKKLKDIGYSIQGYVVSTQPVVPPEATGDKVGVVVSNNNKNSCEKTYRSNVKYYTFNKVTKKLINENYTSNLEYVETFTKIMNVNEDGTNYSYKIDYHTVDGIHWDETTTKKYVQMMFEDNNNL